MSGSTNVKRLLLTAIAVFLMPIYLFAGNTGKITGVVKDKETGDALPGVNVILEGTTMGAATNAKGEYTILNVPAGVYTVTTNMISYAKVTKQNVRVIPDFTTKLDFELVPTSVSGEEVTVIAERPLIQKDQTMTMTVTSSEEIKNLPVRGFQSAANLGAGIVINNTRNLEGGTGNVNIRGGRANETGVYIDGFQQNNLLTGTTNSSVPNGAVEELQVITGGFDAEYGRNQSGIIQVVTKSGGQKYSGNLEWVGDPGGLGIAESYGYNVLSGGVGGQVIPGNNKLRFFVSGEGRNIKDAEPSVWGFPQYTLGSASDSLSQAQHIQDTAIWQKDANGNIVFKKGARPNGSQGAGVNSDKGLNLQGKFTFDAVPNKLRFDVTGNYSGTWRRSFIADRTLDLPYNLMRRINNYNLGAIATYTINQNSFFDFSVGGQSNERKLYNDFYGFKFNDTISPAAPLDAYGRVLTVAGNPRSAIDGKNNYILYNSHYANPYGYTGYLTYFDDNLLQDINRGTRTFSIDKTQYISFKGNYTNQIDKHNQFKAGFDYFSHEVRRFNLRDTDNPIYGFNDAIGYTVKTDANGRAVLGTNNTTNLDNKLLGPAKPYSFALFGQDKLEYEGLVLRAGIRYDLFNSGTKEVIDYRNPTDPGNDNGKTVTAQQTQILSIVQTNHGPDTTYRSGVLDAHDYQSSKSTNKFSPRLSVSFPISEKSQFRISYGKFFQQPNLQDLYISPKVLENLSTGGGTATTIPNSGLKAEETTQYEVGFRRAITDYAFFDVSAYYKDIKNLINTTNYASYPSNLILQTNIDEGVIQGINLSMEFRRVGKFQGRLAYTLQSARGTGSAEASGFRSAWLGFQETRFNAPLNFDQRHTINGQFDIRNAKGEGPIVGGTHPLENAGINFLVTAGSGLPYTPWSTVPYIISGVPGGRVLARRNSQNMPWTFRIDLKADKTFNISGNMTGVVYVQVLNLLDTKNVTNVYPATGRADDNGFPSSSFGAGSLNQRQLDQYQIQFHDGFNWDTPRQARVGVLFNF